MKKVCKTLLSVFCVLYMLFTTAGCKSSPEDQAVKRIKEYMDAVETGDQEALMECMDPRIQTTSKGVTDTLAGLFNIENGYDTGNAFSSLLNGALQDMSDTAIKLKYEKVYKSEMKEKRGNIVVQYQMNVYSKSNDKDVNISVIIPFEMIIRDSAWYVLNAGEAAMIVDEDGNKITPSTINIKKGRPFSDGVAWVKTDYKWKCIDKKGNVKFSLKISQTPATDFKNDVAVVQGADGKIFVVNKYGKEIISEKKQKFTSMMIPMNDKGSSVWGSKVIIVFNEVDTFDKNEYQIGVLNLKGDWITPLHSGSPLTVDNNDDCFNYYKKYCKLQTKETRKIDWVNTMNPTEKSVYYYNPETNKVFEGYKDIDFYKGTGIVQVENSVLKINIADNTETKILDNVESIGKFNEGMFFVQKEDGTSGFYDPSGKCVIDLSQYQNRYKNTPVMENGYALLSLTNEAESEFFAFIRKDGKIMFEPINTNKSSLEYFPEEGVILCKETARRKQVYDVKGKPKFEDIANDISNIGDGAAMVTSSTAEGIYYIDMKGKKLF